MPKAFFDNQGSGCEHPTPDAIFDAYDKEFGPFTLDPATAIGYHSSNVILDNGGVIVTLAGTYDASPDDAIAEPTHYPDRADGLAIPWYGRVWLNHPYGRDDWRWIKKARDSVRRGNADLVCALVPVKTQMRWWRRYVCGSITRNTLPPHQWLVDASRPGSADVIQFVPGRIRFGDSTTGPEPYSAPFASAIVVWRR